MQVDLATQVSLLHLGTTFLKVLSGTVADALMEMGETPEKQQNLFAS